MTVHAVTVTSLSPEEEMSSFQMDIGIVTADRKGEPLSNLVTITLHVKILIIYKPFYR